MNQESSDDLTKNLGAKNLTSMQETFDLYLTTASQGPPGVRISLRVKANGGKAESVVVKKNYANVVVIDLLCLHR